MNFLSLRAQAIAPYTAGAPPAAQQIRQPITPQNPYPPPPPAARLGAPPGGTGRGAHRPRRPLRLPGVPGGGGVDL